jgi:hypothetical protein
MDEQERQRWIEEAKREALAPWDHKRGTATIDRNAHAVHVRASVEQTAAFLSRTAVRWERDVLNRTVCPGARNLIVFRLRGHHWTIIADEEVDAQGLSRSLQTDVIDYTVSDTCGSIGYTLFENGEQTEHFFGSEGDNTDVFESKRRSVSRQQRKDIWGLVHQFFLAHDAFEPGLDYEYFFRVGGEEPISASRLVLLDVPPRDSGPCVRNPGIVINIAGEDVVSRPEFERIDFVVTQEAPGKAGRLLLG